MGVRLPRSDSELILAGTTSHPQVTFYHSFMIDSRYDGNRFPVNNSTLQSEDTTIMVVNQKPSVCPPRSDSVLI